MAAADLHLCVDVTAGWATAVYHHAGATHPVYFNGQARLPTGVLPAPGTAALLTGTDALTAGNLDPDAYHSDPMARLHTGVSTDIDPVAAVAAVLGHIATHVANLAGAPIAQLTVVTAYGWGHRARQRLLQAAAAADLPEPHVVAAATAAACRAVPATTGFAIVATADLDLTVLDIGDGYQQVAYTVIADPAAPGIDDALLAAVAARVPGLDRAPAGWQTRREVHQARTALAGQPRTSLLLPHPHPAVVVDRGDLATAAAPHLARVAETVKQVLADADLDAGDVTAVVMPGNDAVLPELAGALTATGLPEPTLLPDPHALAHGALRVTQPIGSAPARGDTAATARLPRTRLTVVNLARIAVLAAASVALLLQTITTADLWRLGGSVYDARVAVENLGLAAALAVLTAWTAAQLVPTTWLTSAQAGNDTSTGVLLRRGYLGAATLGLAVAGLWGLGARVGVGVPGDSYLQVALMCALPIAACAAVIAVIAPRIPRPLLPGWLERASPPVVAVALAAAGVYLERAALTLTFPVDVIGMTGLVQAGGAALLGIATALTVTRQPLLRAVTGFILAIGYALVSTAATVHYTTAAYIVVLAWWALTTAAVTVSAATPQISASVKRWTGLRGPGPDAP
jgi:hypothetical protein